MSKELPSPATKDCAIEAHRWSQDFPIRWEEDHCVTRRELAKFLTLGSGTLVAATASVALVGDRLRRQAGRLLAGVHAPLLRGGPPAGIARAGLSLPRRAVRLRRRPPQRGTTHPAAAAPLAR